MKLVVNILDNELCSSKARIILKEIKSVMSYNLCFSYHYSMDMSFYPVGKVCRPPEVSPSWGERYV